MEILSEIFATISAGGWVSYPLLFTSGLLSYAISFRLIQLQRGDNRSVRMIINAVKARPEPSDDQNSGILERAIRNCVRKLNESNQVPAKIIETELFDWQKSISQYRKIIHTIVLITPLMGLLGTVIGMIETFDSLGDMSLFTQSGGIAGGISKALITTQMGLVIAIPGLFFDRFLTRREEKLRDEFEQIKDILTYG